MAGFDRMAASSASHSEAARKTESAILRGLARTTQVAASQASGISDVRISRFVSDSPDGGTLHLGEVAALLAALGLVVVDGDAREVVTLPRDELDALRTLARKACA